MKTTITITIEHPEATVIDVKTERHAEPETAKLPGGEPIVSKPAEDANKSSANTGICVICGDKFERKRITQVLCGKDDCKKEYARRANKRRLANDSVKTRKPTEATKRVLDGSMQRSRRSNRQKGQLTDKWPPEPIVPGHPQYSKAQREDVKHQPFARCPKCEAKIDPVTKICQGCGQVAEA